jgi:hypothetical protein
MKGPTFNDVLICKISAEEWVEDNYDHLFAQKYFNTTSGAEAFASSLGNAARHGYLDSHTLARNMKIDTNDDVIDDFDSFSSHHYNVYSRTIKKWILGWSPDRPFDGEYARTTVATEAGEYVGIARINNDNVNEAQLYLYPDKNLKDAKIMAHRYGIFSTGIVLNWEDVTEVLPLTADDEILISDYKAKLIKDEEDTKAYVALNNAQKQMSADVKKYKDLSLEEANAIFNDLNVDENDIPKLISALSKVGIQKRIDNVANTQVQTTRLI